MKDQVNSTCKEQTNVIKKDQILQTYMYQKGRLRMKPLPKFAINKHLFILTDYSAHSVIGFTVPTDNSKIQFAALPFQALTLVCVILQTFTVL